MEKQSLWSTLSVPQRSKIIGAWKSTFLMFCVIFLIGGNVMCHIYELSDVNSLVMTILGFSSGALSEALDIWNDVFIYWNVPQSDHIGRGDWM